MTKPTVKTLNERITKAAQYCKQQDERIAKLERLVEALRSGKLGSK